ncbi:MAG TPA: hypothetical protein ENN21_02090, partial [Spirochaetes bacterium]|nr:hypothetical protein [Spirochaetota bacterium]
MKQIIDAIEGDKSIVLNLYALNNTSEDRIKKALALFLKKHDCVQLLNPLYACLKELLINAVRANYKGIFFENFKNNTITSKIIDNRMAMQLFHLEMTRDEARNLARIARANKIKIELRMEINGTLLKMSVSNPVPIPSGELSAVVDRLNSALKCADLSQFFSEYDTAADDDHDG